MTARTISRTDAAEAAAALQGWAHDTARQRGLTGTAAETLIDALDRVSEALAQFDRIDITDTSELEPHHGR